MKVGIYNEPPDGGIGGSEVSVAVLAEALADRHQVEIIHHKPEMSGERLAQISETDLSAVRMRCVAAEPYPFGDARAPWWRYKEARDWQAALSEPYDLFVNFTHGFPPFCHAPKGVLAVLFPLHDRPRLWVEAKASSGSEPLLWLGFKCAYHDWEWQKRMETYQVKTTISRFAQAWTKRRWALDCKIIYPPADLRFRPRAKTDSILSVGRFTATGHSKKQLEMAAAFDHLRARAPGGWQYFCVGGVSDQEADRRYFQSVTDKSQRSGAQVIANVERHRLHELYGEAKLFWHAAGYGESDEQPEMAEHFGIATVEAMSAGCVPIVINKGGQPEIVQHGESGFVWDKVEELMEYTERLMRDDRLRERMAEAARARAANFSRARFTGQFLSLIE